MDSLLLVGGLLAAFAGVAGTAGALFSFTRDRQAASRRSELLASLSVHGETVRAHELRTPFAERVLAPLTDRFVLAGRRITPDHAVDRIRRRLDLAGNPAGWDVDRVLGTKALGLVLGLLLGFGLPPLLGAGLRATVLVGIAAGLLGWFGPTMWIYQVGYDRTEKIRRELPDALDLLTISVEAGLAFDAALAQVARNSDGPLAAELFRVLQEMQIGTGRADALRGLAVRSDVEELRIFVGALVQAESFGIPIAGVLRVQSREMRVKRGQRAEEKAQQVPVKILFPLIFCVMPALFVVVLGPAAIKIFFELRGV
jgi:tight adherence protein C